MISGMSAFVYILNQNILLKNSSEILKSFKVKNKNYIFSKTKYLEFLKSGNSEIIEKIFKNFDNA